MKYVVENISKVLIHFQLSIYQPEYFLLPLSPALRVLLTPGREMEEAKLYLICGLKNETEQTKFPC